MSVFHPTELRTREALLSRGASLLVIGALSILSWAVLLFMTFKLWRLLGFAF
jgi:hypothetical protein